MRPNQYAADDGHTEAERRAGAGDHHWGVVNGMYDESDDVATTGGATADPRWPSASGPSPGRAERVAVFRVGDVYLFRHYFDGDEVFAALEPYYDPHAYRFEVPAERFRDVRPQLAGHGYELAVVEDPREFAVAVRKYRAHPESVFEDRVLELSGDDHNVFVVKSRAAVERAVADGATPLSDAPVDIDLPGRPDVGAVTTRDVETTPR